MAQKSRRGPPGGSGTPSKIVSAASLDNSDHILKIPICQLLPRPVRPDEIPELRAMWWRQAALGHRLPAEARIIVIDGGRA